VMESLPLMLQFALLLLGCALSRYLWEVNTTIASVVLGVTAFGVASYAFFVVAGAASASCPYQTPGAQFLRHILPLTLSTLRSVPSASSHALRALRSVFSHSKTISMFVGTGRQVWQAGCIGGTILVVCLTPLFLIGVPSNLVIDAYHLTRVVVRGIFAGALNVYGWFRRGQDWFRSAHGSDPQITVLDLQCISWMLRTSLDKAVQLFTLRLLMMTTQADFHSAAVSACIDMLTSCMSIVGGKAAILQGSEELTEVSALCCLRTLSHLTLMDSVSSAFKDIRQQYAKAFPIETDFSGSPSYHRLCMIHNIFHPRWRRVQFRYLRRPQIQWKGYKLSSDDHVILVRLAQFEYQREQCRKVPRWILHYARHLLSQDPLPPTSVVADCLSIIAMDMGCAASNVAAPDERCVHI